jgi:ubiquitin
MASSGAKNQENEAVQSSFDRPSAKIYQFQPKARLALEGRKPAQQAEIAYKIGKSNDIIVTGAWYHDAAIKEDDRGRKG